MAKALLYRGIAYRQQKKPAQAIADLTSALWLKGGLGETDRDDALKQRTSAYQEAGLAETGEPIAAGRAGRTRAPTRTASASRGRDFAASHGRCRANAIERRMELRLPAGSAARRRRRQPPAPPPAPSTTASIDAAPQARVRAAAPAGPNPADGRAAPRCAGGPERAAAAVRRRRPSPKAASASRSAWCAPRPRRSPWPTKVQRDHAAALATREPEIDETVVGNMGSFYRVRIGPFASAQEGQAACAKLKGTGIDCLVVTQ